ncbi:Peptidase inhibitor I78 family protein [Loktanella fryxellensis]|uniref:Peptidase inhibitor I78 family protein n=1 Tax=Loktanella fryxellensis TaxID=245187 RepID=A0A1H8FJM4_9RHOB|nr:I78 family peptidase inhibitor [Loktanella fryxellensis]SEN31805.1 Peptidase inhibitor I78 family protein [Loktanella fryxellensis]
MRLTGRHRGRLIWLAPLALAACGAAVPSPPPAAPGAQPVAAGTVPTGPGVENSCGAGRHASLLGKDATVLERVLIMAPVQVLRPGGIAAQDFIPDRINFIIGADNRITAITCG